ncbi:MAG: gliding motility-associated C-terminal domain-containing protein [Paludibacteraceae bacterium]|nr:gliding motility-associated C-terminal domain-containing protein [Paludibacteraceae bacterium]
MSKKVLRRKSFFLSIVLFFLISNIYAEGDTISYLKAFSETLNGGFIWVGNTNTNPADNKYLDPATDKEAEIKNINIYPTGYTASSFTNINFDYFCVPKIDELCGKLKLEFSELNWVYGNPLNGQPNNSVNVIITNEAGDNIISEFSVTAGTTKNISSAKFYSHHADITDEISALYNAGTLETGVKYRIYVANIKVDLGPAPEKSNNGTGWSFSIVYSHPLLNRRTIMFYDVDAFAETGYQGVSGQTLNLYLAIKKGFKLIDDKLTFGYSGFGSMYNTGGEYIESNELSLPIVDQGNDKWNDKNPLKSSIYYKYEDGCGISQLNNMYTRSFDLRVASIDKASSYVDQKDTEHPAFNVYISGENENHFLTNAVVAFGAPDVPEATLPVEVDKDNINPDEEYTCNFFITVGENTDGLKNINVDIPITEYVDSISNFEITFLESAAINKSWYKDYLTVKTSLGGDPQIDLRNYSNVTGYKNTIDKFNKAVIDKVNAYLRDVDQKNAELFETNPSQLISRQVKLDFGNMVIPTSVKNKDVIKITLTLHTKPADDEVYRKTTYNDTKPTYVQEAEISVASEKTDEKSTMESVNRKDPNHGLENSTAIDDYFKALKCDGDGGGGLPGCEGCTPDPGCEGLGGGPRQTTEGLFQKNRLTEPVEIVIDASSECISVPDSIEIPYCNQTTIYAAEIYDMLYNYYQFDLDSIVKLDSCIWEQTKRNKLLQFAKEHGVNQSRMESLLSNMDHLPSITAGAANYDSSFDDFLNCEVELTPDSVDSIVNMKIDYSQLFVLYESEDTTDYFQGTNSINIMSEEAHTHQYTIDKDLVTYAYFRSPWKNGGCDKYIKVKFIKTDLKAPVVVYKKDTIKEGETVYACLEEIMKPMTIYKDHNNYDIYGEVTDLSGVKHSSLWLNRNRKTDDPYNWELAKDTIVSSKEPGVFDIAIVKRNYLDRCFGDTLKFKLKIIDIKIDVKPIILDKDSKGQMRVCQSLYKGDMITLKIDTNAAPADLDVKWYSIITTDDLDENGLPIKEAIELGVGDSISVPRDSAGTFEYAAEFFKDQCPSEQDTIFVAVDPYPEKLEMDTISICQHYDLKADDIIKRIGDLNTGYDINNVLFYTYNNSTTDQETNLLYSIAKDSITLNDFLDQTGIPSLSCVTGENYQYVNYVAQPQSANSCIGFGSLGTIKISCYDNTKPEFTVGDSILYCTNDSASKNLNEFIKDKYNENDKWVWRNVLSNSKLPSNGFEVDNYSGIAEIFDPLISTKTANTSEFSVVRVDSNSCVSDSSVFRVVVGSAIYSTPYIGDTTKYIYENNHFLVEFCPGDDSQYPNDVLRVKATEQGYTMTAVQKTSFVEDCDTLYKYDPVRLEWNSVKQDSIVMPIKSPGQYYYCIRQTTSVGCNGPWANITIVVRDSVKGDLTVDSIFVCEKEPSKKVVDFVHNKTTYNEKYYDKDGVEINKELAVAESDVPGKYLSSNHQNLFYVSLFDTKCAGEKVPVQIIVNEKPSIPNVTNDTLYYCLNDAVDLTVDGGVTVNKNKEILEWNKVEKYDASVASEDRFLVRVLNTETSCYSDYDSIDVFVEKTFDYTPIAPIQKCYGDSVDLWEIVDDAIDRHQTIITQANPTFEITSANGTVVSETAARKIYSTKVKTVEDIQKYYISVQDPISGCSHVDSVTIQFAPLPEMKPDSVNKCENEVFALPTPQNTPYTYEWYNKGTRIINESAFSSGEDEKLTLVATTGYNCVDSVNVIINIDSLPGLPLIKDTSLCQGSGNHKLNVDYTSSVNSDNKYNDLYFYWEDANKIQRENFNADTTFTDSRINVKYVGVIKNIDKGTHCMSSKEITVTVNKKISLSISDPAPICQPDVFDAASYIKNYRNTNTIGGHNPKIDYYFTLNSSLKKDTLTETEMSSLAYSKASEEVQYGYVMIDSDKICSTEDTFTVTINTKPAAPLIENGEDSLFFCRSNAPLKINASDTTYSDNQRLVWQDGQIGLQYSLDEKDPWTILKAYFEDTLTSCQSDMSTSVAVVASSIVAKPIGGKDTLAYCSDSVVNLWDLAYKSFEVDAKYRSNFVMSAQKGTNVMLQSDLEHLTSTVQDTSTYQFELHDELTNCSQRNEVTVIFHELPHFSIDGEKEICSSDSISLKVTGDNRPISYKWYYDSSLLSTGLSYKQLGLTKDTTLTVVGALNDLPTCVSKTSHKVIVDTLPTVLRDTTIGVCQDTTGAPVEFQFDRDAANGSSNYAISWYNNKGDVLLAKDVETISQPIVKDSIFVYKVNLTDRNTGCVSDFASMKITVYPQIRSKWIDPDTICQPDSFNMLVALNKAIYGGKNPTYQFTLNNSSNDTIHNETAIKENSKLTAYYLDNNGCELKQPVSIQFFPEPNIPTIYNDTSVCQELKTITLQAVSNGVKNNTPSSQSFEWVINTRDTIKANTIDADLSYTGKNTYEVRAYDLHTQCYSQPDTFTMTIRDSIQAIGLDTLKSCYNVPVDLTAQVEKLKGGLGTLHYEYSLPGTLETVAADKIVKTGSYLVKVSDSMAVCQREEKVNVLMHDSLGVHADGPRVLCEISEITLTASNADSYVWRRSNGAKLEGESLLYKSDTAKTEVVKLIGSKLIGTLTCQDSIDVTILTNPNPKVLPDSTIYVCQDTASKSSVIQVGFDRATDNITSYILNWYDKEDATQSFSSKETIDQSIKDDSTFIYWADLTDRVTGCVSPRFKMTVVVQPMLRTKWKDPQPVCEPFTYNLQNALQDVNNFYGGKGKFTHYVMNGSDTLKDETKISKNSNLMAYFTDKNGCKLKQEITIKFHSEPNIPTVPKDTDMCQAQKVVSLTAQSNGVKDGTPSPQIFEWVMNDKETLLAKTQDVDLNKSGKNVYRVRAYDTITKCYSQPDTITLVIRDSIQAIGLDTLKSCYNVPVDLTAQVEKLKGGLGTLHYEYSLPGTLETVAADKIVKTGSYLVKVSDSMAVCQREEKVNVLMHDSLGVHADGPRVLCEISEITLTASNADSYVWRRSNGAKLEGESLLYKSDTAKTEVVKLIGSKLIGTLTCQDSIDVTILTNPNPKVLPDSTIYVCQDTASKSSVIQVGFDRATDNITSYILNWYDKEDATQSFSSKETIDQSIKDDSTFIYWADLTDRVTGCVSPRFKMTVVVQPMLRTKWKDPQPVCEPFTYNLQNALQDVNNFYGGKGKFTHYVMNGSDTLKDETKISKNSNLMAYFTDKNGCKLKQEITIKFHSEPNIPTVPKDTDMCQAQKVVSLTAQSNGVKDGTPSPQIFEWVMNDKETLLAKTQDVDLNKSGKNVYRVRAYDTITKCYSQPDTITLVIRDSIQAIELDTLKSCYNVPVDLIAQVEKLKGGLGTLHYEYELPGALETFDPKAIVKSGSYLVRVSDSMKVCQREEMVNVLVRDSLGIEADGPRVLCEYSEITLEAKYADSYIWRNANGKQVSGASLVYKSDTEKTETIRLIGIKQIGQLMCEDSIDVTIVTNPNPIALHDTTIDLCQDTAGSPVSLSFNRPAADIDAYPMRWYDKDGNMTEKEKISQSIQEAGTFEYEVEVYNKKTNCVSERFNMTVHVHPQIRSKWIDPDTICQPYTFDLMESLSSVIEGGTNPTYQYTLMGTDTIHNETKIAENSYLKVYYKDDKGCELVQPVSVQFYPQPSMPTLVGDTIVCQSIGDVILSASKNGSNTLNQTFMWEGRTAKVQDTQFVVSTDQFGTSNYTLKAVDTLSHCYSEPVSFTFDIRKKIAYQPVELIETCFKDALDITSRVEPNYTTNIDTVTYSYFFLPENGSKISVARPDSVAQSGKYLVMVNEKESKCQRQDTFEVVAYDSIGVATIGTDTICYGDVVPDLKAINADSYVWRRGTVTSEGANFPFENSVQETETFRLIGQKKIGSLYCYDSIDVTVTVNPNPQTLPDTIVNLCQLKDGDDAKVLVPTKTDSGELLMLKWFDSNHNEVFENLDVATFSVKEAGTTTYSVQQKNLVTGCVSKLSSVKAVVYPQIEILLPDTATCQPYTIDLVQLAKKSATARDMTPLVVVDSIYYGLNKTNNVTNKARSLTESGVYEVYYSYTTNGLTCTASGLSTLTFYKQPEIPSVESQEFCQNTGSQLLTGMPLETNLRLIWENISSVPSTVDTVNSYVSTDLAGTRYYKVRHIQDNSNCLSKDTTIVVTIHPEVKPLKLQHDECYGESVSILEIANTYSIKDTIKSLYNQTLSVAYPSLSTALKETGVYTFVAKNEHGCMATDTLNLTFHRPENVKVSGFDKKYCYGDKAEFVATATNSCTFTWVELPFLDDERVSPDFIIEGKKDYMLIARENSLGCLYQYEFSTINALDKIQPKIGGALKVCSDGVFQLKPKKNYVSVRWSYNDTLVDRNTIFTHSASDINPVYPIQLWVEDNNHCHDSISDTVKIIEYVTPIIYQQNTYSEWDNKEGALDLTHNVISFSTDLDGEFLSYKWWMTDTNNVVSTSPSFTYEFEENEIFRCDDQYMFLTVTVEDMCSRDTFVALPVRCKPFVPNSFVADGNSKFMDKYKLQIYDRVGTLIFETEDREGWDGSYRGKGLASNDTYFYVLFYHVHGKEETMTGYVTLAREK